MPSQFVTESAFDRHLAYLLENALVLPLMDAIALLRKDRLPDRAVALTFDDGYANNLYLAMPLLRKYDFSATIFVSTACVESGDFFPFDILRLVRLLGTRDGDQECTPLLDYKHHPLSQVMTQAHGRWQELLPRLTTEQRETLRPLTRDEILRFDSKQIELGAHGHRHAILRNEPRCCRDWEITSCIDRLTQWTGMRTRVFSYPNGQVGDFDDSDQRVLQAQGIEAAVTGIAGRNFAGTNAFELKRYPVGIYHDTAGFASEVVGFHTALRSVRWA